MGRIAIIGENSIDYIDTLIDIWNKGDCAVLLDWRIPFKALYTLMLEANVSSCYIESKFIETIKIQEFPFIRFITYTKTTVVATRLPSTIYDKYMDNYSDSEAVVIYSSGTTGKYKGIILSHFAISTNADSIHKYLQPKANDVFSIVKSISHSSTLVGELLVSLKYKIPLVVFPEYSFPGYIFRAIADFEITTMFVNPNLLDLYSRERAKKKDRISSLHSIYVSGSILENAILNNAQKQFGNVDIFNVYGLTEAGPRVSAQTKIVHNGTSVGVPIDGVSIVIFDELGNPQKNGKIGSIYIKTPCCFNGYVNGQKENRIKNGWLDSGDVGYIDELGELTIVGRKDTCLLFQSHNVYPERIENILMMTGFFTECLVDLRNSKLICYYSTHNKRNLQCEEVKKIIQMCKNELPSYEIPSDFIFREKLERNNSGKLIRRRNVYEFKNTH